MENIVVIDGEISLQNHMDGEWDLNIPADGDPNVIIVEGGGQTYPHYSGSYTVTPSTSQQVLQTDGKVMDDDVTVQAVPQGSATTPATIITANPSISVSSGGLITATVSKTQQITPTVQEGYVETGTAGNVGVSGSNTEQLSVQGAQTIHPASTDQSIASGKYLTGAQTFKAVTVSGLSADKIVQGTTVEIGDADDSDRIMKVVGTAQGGITPTGTKQITANGTNIDVYNYQYADVAVPNSYSAGDEGKVVSNGALVAQTSDTVTTNDTYDTTLINSLTVNVSGGGGGSVTQDQDGYIILPTEGGGSANFAKGTVTYASNTTVDTKGTVLNLSIPFKPDMFMFFMTKDGWNAQSSWVNNNIYLIAFYKESIFTPIHVSATTGTETDKNSDGYIVFKASNVAVTSGNSSGYGVNGIMNIVNCNTYPNWQIVQDGSNYKVQVARFSTAAISIPAGTFNWVAWKF